MVAKPVRPETATKETSPLENKVNGEASNNEADTANADTNNPLDNKVEGDATNGASNDRLERPDLVDPANQEAMVAGEATVTRQKRRTMLCCHTSRKRRKNTHNKLWVLLLAPCGQEL